VEWPIKRGYRGCPVSPFLFVRFDNLLFKLRVFVYDRENSYPYALPKGGDEGEKDGFV
jgi:hypothetical protein